MNDFAQPYPPLAIIEARLFGEPAVIEGDIPAEPESQSEIPTLLPDWLQHRIRQVARQPAQTAPASPAAGQIWSLAYEGQVDGQTLSGRIPVLLDQPLGEGRWRGWIVSDDTDYAALDDVILDTEALSLAPMVSQVQTWNKVQAQWSTKAPFLGQLPDNQLASVRRVAASANRLNPHLGEPCQLVWRDLAPGWSVLTGQPLGNAQDPRWAYRQLYRRFALACLPELSNEQEFDV